MTHTHVRRTIWTALVALAFVAPATSRAQDIADKLQFHASLDWGYGLSDGLPVFGINHQGTTDYKTIAVQFRYLLDDKDQFVTQLLSLSLGTSPMAATQPTIEPVWAYYQHKEGDWTFKIGRDPLPRGIYNEVRRIGTLLPFYRVGSDVYQETLEYIDGVVVSRRFDLGHDWSLEGNAFAGGTDLKALLPSSPGVGVIQARLENLYGGQLWVNTPIKGLRAGAFASAYQIPGTNPSLTTLYSLDGNFEHFFVRGEYTEFSSKGPKSDYTSWYGMGGIKLGDKVTLATQYMVANRYISFPAPIAPMTVQLSTDVSEGIAYAPSANVAFKFEVHRHMGYSFDTNVPTFVPPTGPPFVMGLAPASKANYLLASVALSF
jgi:hypothetical protein